MYSLKNAVQLNSRGWVGGEGGLGRGAGGVAVGALGGSKPIWPSGKAFAWEVSKQMPVPFHASALLSSPEGRKYQ